jgi:hypothetical protein
VCSCSFVNEEYLVVYYCMFLSCVSKCTFSNTAVAYCTLASQNLLFQTAADFSVYLIIFWMKCNVLKLKLLKFKAFCNVNTVSLSLWLMMYALCLSCWILDPGDGTDRLSWNGKILPVLTLHNNPEEHISLLQFLIFKRVIILP